jgi:hypothetical protein
VALNYISTTENTVIRVVYIGFRAAQVSLRLPHGGLAGYDCGLTEASLSVDYSLGKDWQEEEAVLPRGGD